jgi:RHS repeat-associated protein
MGSLTQLSSYDILGTTHTITYDSQGNPTTITNFAYKGVNYHHANLSWDGRALRTIEVYNASDVLVATISYRYNDQGYRTEKDIYEVATNTTQTITYTLSGDKVLDESDGTYQLVYTYDYDGTIIRFYYDANSGDSVSGADYFYLRNQQGDITTIIDNGGNTVVKYRYDAYGNILGLVDNSTGDIISKMNPYTYRGYRYDSEIGYYYLNSRYYNPEIGRFINADGMLGEMGDIPSTNMYAYCANNPVMYIDPSGNITAESLIAATNWWNPVGWIAATVLVVEVILLVVATVEIFNDIKADIELKERIGVEVNESDTHNTNSPVYFPENPADFHPNGLLPVVREGTYNGPIITWMLDDQIVFRYDSNISKKNGSHYHINDIGFVHFYSGDKIPEPYATIYFGGQK